jgi:GT2 family glycosyltransferase
MEFFEDVGVMVLAYGVARAVPSLVEQLRAEGLSPESIVVVRNQPPHPTLAPEALPADIVSIDLAENLGYAGGMNVGIRRHLADGRRWILLLTEDSGLRPGSATSLVEAAKRSTNFGVLGPVVGWLGGGRVFSYGGVSKANGDIDHLRQGAPPATVAGIARCDWIDGAVMLLSAHMLDRVGLLDERFFLYFEDTELCLRARRAGWNVGVVVDARSEEKPGLDRRPGAYAYLHARNGLEYARLAAGNAGVRAALRRHLRELRAALRRLAAASNQDRAGQWLRLRSEWWGVFDFMLRRRGAPPRRLPGQGDLQ